MCGNASSFAIDFYQGSRIIHFNCPAYILIGYGVIVLIAAKQDTAIVLHLQPCPTAYLEVFFG